MGLGDVARKARSPQSLAKLTKELYSRKEEVPPLDAGSMLRASGIASVCPREEVLCVIHGVVRQGGWTADQNLNFLLGSGMHWALQNELLPTIGVFYGRWTCLKCGLGYGGPEPDEAGECRVDGGVADAGLVLRPVKCDQCGSHEFFYRELMFSDEQYRIGGHCDGFLQEPRRTGLGVFEAKSIADRWFSDVRDVPMVQHVVQMQTYMWLTGLTWAKILYWNKGGWGVKAFREHFVDRDEESIERIKRAIRSIWDGIASGDLPKRICGNRLCKRAKGCGVREICFEGVKDKAEAEYPF